MPSILSIVTSFKREFDPKIHSTRLYEAFAEVAKQLTSLGAGEADRRLHCRATSNAGLNVPTGVATALAFNLIRTQVGTLHSSTSQNTRFTASRVGSYIITAHIQWPAALVGIRQLQIKANGANIIASRIDFAQAVAALQDQSIACGYYLNVGDYVEVIAFQNSGGALVIPVAGNYSPEAFIGEL
jgi:hypothetical protein